MSPFLIPIIIRVATKLADLAFQKLAEMPVEKQKPVIKKIEKDYDKSKVNFKAEDDTYVG